MAIERRDQLAGTYGDPDVKLSGSEMSVSVDPDRQDLLDQADEVLVTQTELLIDDEMDQVEPAMDVGDFDANLVDYIDDTTLSIMSTDILGSIEKDKESRSEWEKTYTDGLKYLGMKFDESRSQPFEGSSGVIHPILAEATTQFQAQAYKEMLPAKGPVKTQIIGQRTAEVETQADRVQEFMNFYIMNVMKDYDPELDMLLFYLPLAGSAFKKV